MRGDGRFHYDSFVADIHNVYKDLKSKNQDLANTRNECKINNDRLQKLTKGTHNQNTFNYFKINYYNLDFKGVFKDQHIGSRIADSYKDPLFHSLIDFMRVGDFTYTNMKRHAPGLYRAYRPSSTFPGNYWVGALEIYINDNSGAICTYEFYKSNNFDGRTNKVVQFNGYLIRKGRHYSIVSRNQSQSSLCVALLPSVTIESRRITNLTGATIDMSTGHLWTGRVIFDRIDLPNVCVSTDRISEEIEVDEENYPKLKKEFFESACICTAEEIPKSIRHHFSHEQIPNLQMF